MTIALLGYGKMGKHIEAIALQRNHSIGLKTNSQTKTFDFTNIDVAIDFSLPNTAVSNIKMALDANIPVISGTTGWLQHYDDIVEYCNAKNGAFLYASNFSLGVNIFFELNKKLATLMQHQSDYKVSIEEIHHTEKLDEPSGTAISLANAIIKNSAYENWTLNQPKPNEIGITAKRIPKVCGTHTITYNSKIDNISITHEAHNRQGFALGAVIAAEWIKGKKGVFTMKEVLQF